MYDSVGHATAAGVIEEGGWPWVVIAALAAIGGIAARWAGLWCWRAHKQQAPQPEPEQPLRRRRRTPKCD
jgi:uncharacterized iron-regulated membrane protein